MSSSQILKLARKLELTAEQERDFVNRAFRVGGALHENTVLRLGQWIQFLPLKGL
ncbi:hypothetical protein [uncultured Akkermansia sp.]|uniref:hypothetical protein n=1 Tax=uncultured Akkermansia sp. TaxID=512294 RepID=UPI00261FF94B|nr:hypothetical protein [uncultured Akkermansia sp.]